MTDGLNNKQLIVMSWPSINCVIIRFVIWIPAVEQNWNAAKKDGYQNGSRLQYFMW